ncbi:hypothetical protein B296_00019748 [Ensete ventricosum]|uniref:Uncharacterized protein n=1 Tax=Ensete ventricosum TaxID=4639 RepID=A0A427A706_ENSVE|nr:hypothetical protein B296_00019748 [Ensete ventricosum]
MAGEKPSVELCKGVNGLDKVVLRDARGSSAEVPSFFAPFSESSSLVPTNFFPFYNKRSRILCHLLLVVYLFGGHVTSWRTDHREELLFVSNKVLISCLVLSPHYLQDSVLI